ncbi:MAG TPA: Rieske 2Fe-2S domain-containing protein, partial [Chloroflexia bacterium]|nr:Rieske 2Fe-2S domain-containing protein [Chloroflexia bacterium]
VLGALTLLVSLAQAAGVLVQRRRQLSRAQTPARSGAVPAALPAATGLSLVPAAAEEPGASLTRRAFLILGGTALAAGLATLVSFKIARELLPPAGVAPAVPGPEGSRLPVGPGPNAVAPPTPGTRANPTPTSPPVAANPAPAATAAPGKGENPGVVLATLATCPVNSSITFTTPDTGQPGILVHEADGSVKAFSSVCTHRPYPVEYDTGSQLLVCPLHQACWNAASGRVTRGPARRALPSIPVHVDTQGNILYG